MPTGRLPICHYPQGGIAKSAGGRGIFRDAAGEPIRIWVDYMLKSARSIIKAAQHEDEVDSDTSIASAYHYEPETQLLILHPSSHHIFDSYCHPDWLTARGRKKYDKYREEHGDEEEEWTRKVLLKDSWVWRCIAAGRFLGESDDWGGCRVGGPPKGQVVDVQTDVDMITLNDGVKRKASVDDIDVDMDVNMELDELEEEMEEDIKPSLHLEPVDIPESLDIQIELHTPSQPPNDARTDELPPAGGQEEMDPVFEEKEPSPPPVRRSSRRSRSTTRLVQVKDELESSDEEPLSSKPQPSRSPRDEDTSRPSSSRQGKMSAAASLAEEEDLDISMLDSGPSSQFQSPPPRPPVVEGKIFSGLVFWVDLSMKNRGDLLKEIKTAGGKIAADHEDASHVLIYKFAQQALQWKEIIAELAPKGIWFLSPDWAKKSVAEKKRLPEIDHCVPGGTLAGSTSALEVVEAGIPQQTPDAVKTANKHTGFLDKSFKTLKASGLTEQEIAENMHSRGGAISIERWKYLYKAWTERIGVFSQLPPLPKPNSSAFAPLEETVLRVKTERPSQTPVKPVKGRLSKSDLEGIFAKETWRLGKTCYNNINTLVEFIAHKYGIFALGTWTNYYSEWSNGRGRWTEGRRMFQGVSLTPEQLCEGPITTAPTPITRSNTVQSSEDSSHVPISEIASALFSYFQHSGNDIVINALLGEHMTALHPAYTAQKWEELAHEWKDGSNKFAGFGPRWNGDPSAIPNPFPGEESETGADGPVIPDAGQMRYTEEEELSMGTFALHQESIGQPVTNNSRGDSWAPFAEVYPYRTKMAWSTHFRRDKDRIVAIAKRHAATQAAINPDPEDHDPTYSDRSPSPVASGSQSKPKRQKVAVSKKDYEDLARFIVDNIAEGDVPDSKDFAAFSKDHLERSGSSWYTIWHRDKYRSTLLPLIDELRRAATPRSQSSQVRAARAGSRPHPNAYTDEEERQMAEFIVRHVPSDRPPKVADWNKFQRTHTKLTAPSWTEHYRVYKPRIDGLVAEIKATNPSIARHPSGTAQDAIELGSEEEEEEEVEEIVPIRPPRSRSRRSDVIIIED